MGIRERLGLKHKRTPLEEMILIFETVTKPKVERYIMALNGPDQAIADGTLRTVESEMLSDLVQQTLAPPKIGLKNVHAPVPLGQLKVQVP